MALGRQDSAAEGFAGRIVGWLGAYLISFVGILHLLLSGEHMGYAPYLGALFLVNAAASAVSAVGLARTGERWAWALGAAVAGGALLALLWSRIFGLPGYPEGVGQWFNFAVWMALGFELPFLAVAGLALTARGRALVGAEQRRIDREELPPARQETPEHFALLEGEMREIRDRMSADVWDFRAHLDPRILGEKTKRGVRDQLRALLLGLGRASGIGGTGIGRALTPVFRGIRLRRLPPEPPGEDRLQSGCFFVGQGARTGTHRPGEAGEDLDVYAVVLGEPTDGPGEVPGLTGFHDHHGDPGEAGGDGRGRGSLVASAGLQDDGLGAYIFERPEEGVDALPIFGHGEESAAGHRADVEASLGDVDADATWPFGIRGAPVAGVPSSTLWPGLADTGSRGVDAALTTVRAPPRDRA